MLKLFAACVALRPLRKAPVSSPTSDKDVPPSFPAVLSLNLFSISSNNAFGGSPTTLRASLI